MDVSTLATQIHPLAQDFLFKHYRAMRKIFRNVLGLFEIDYLCIALITPQHELLFMSSEPSIEFNLIEHNLWSLDPSLQKAFFQSGKMQFWGELYSREADDQLCFYKQKMHRFHIGLSIPSVFDKYRIIYTFAAKSDDLNIRNNLKDNTENLLSMGQFCLKTILNEIALPGVSAQTVNNNKDLTFVLNNQVHYEQTT
jgi:hypothetical protein